MNDSIRNFSTAGEDSGGFAWMWLGQGGFAYRFGRTTVVVDPYLSDAVTSLPRAYPREAEPFDIAGDLLLTTHGHDDHFDPETVECAVRHADMTIAGPRSCHLLYQQRALPVGRFYELNEGDRLDFRNITITAVKAKHDSSHGLADSVGFILSGCGVVVYHVGDCAYNECIAEQARGLAPDWLFVPINGKWGNMSAREAALLARNAGARVAVPMHFDMFLGNQEDSALFTREMKETGVPCEVIVPKRWMLHSEIMK